MDAFNKGQQSLSSPKVKKKNKTENGIVLQPLGIFSDLTSRTLLWAIKQFSPSEIAVIVTHKSFNFF